MKSIYIRHPESSDEEHFIEAMKHSAQLHSPWVKGPSTKDEFQAYLQRCQNANYKSYLVCTADGIIAGVYNISEIVMSCFQSAYLGYYAVDGYAGKGYMSAGLKLLLNEVFNQLKLHRIEANIQPDNIKSIKLVSANGFKKEGYSPRYLMCNGEWKDHERWAITAEDWVCCK